MPAFIVAALLKYGVPLLMQILQKTGAVNWGEKVAIKAGVSLVNDIGKLKIYNAPSDYPYKTKTEISQGQENSNFNKSK